MTAVSFILLSSLFAFDKGMAGAIGAYAELWLGAISLHVASALSLLAGVV